MDLCRRLFLTAMALLAGACAGHAQTDGPEVWFDDVTAPVELGAKSTEALCRGLFRIIRGEQGIETIAGLVPDESSERAVFLACSNGSARARVDFGVGRGLAGALRDALAKATADQPSRGCRWLKLDIVQAAIPVGGFIARETAMPLPSLVGLAFGPASGFAFTPEQLIGWHMVDSKRRLTIHHINRFFVDNEDWDAAGRWLRISTFPEGHKVVLFETEAYFTDGDTVISLFRGHRLFERVTVEDLLEAAVGAADRLVEACGSDGNVEIDVFEWLAEPEGINGALQTANAMLAMIAVYKATEAPRYLDCAKRLAARLSGRMARYGKERPHACVVQDQYWDLDPHGIEAPRPITSLDTNAATVCAFLELDALLPDAPFREHCVLLARHILSQGQADGDFVAHRIYPSMRIVARPDPADNALAALALIKLYERFKRPGLLEAAGRSIEYLLKTQLEARDMEALPRAQALMAALDAYFTFERQDRLVLQVQRLALAAVADQVREPSFPDLFGSVSQLPSATVAADRSRLLVSAARLLRDAGREEAAADLLADILPGLLFQLQARIRPPSAMYMARPGSVMDLFRDHLRGFAFDLRGQVTQISSLLEVRAALIRAGLTECPRSELVIKQLAASRTGIDAFPRVLSPELAIPGSRQREGTSSSTGRPGSPAPAIRPVPKR